MILVKNAAAGLMAGGGKQYDKLKFGVLWHSESSVQRETLRTKNPDSGNFFGGKVMDCLFWKAVVCL